MNLVCIDDADIADRLKPGANYQIWRPIHPHDQLDGLAWSEAMCHILRFGILAPSAHNKQGWAVHLNEQACTVRVSPRRTDIGSPSDVVGRQTYLGVGCFAENLCWALQAYGLAPSFQVTAEPCPSDDGGGEQSVNSSWGVTFPISTCAATHPCELERLTAMTLRRSYRGPFIPDYSLDKAVLPLIAECLGAGPVLLTLITRRDQKILIGELQAAADRVALLDRAFRHELSHLIAPNDSADARVMPGDTFGLSDQATRRLQASLAANGAFDGDLAAGLGQAQRDWMITASAIGILSVAQDHPAQWILAGMALERIWLTAQQHGLAFGVAAGMIESQVHHRELMRLAGIKKRPLVAVFRMGKARETRPHSPRIDIGELFTPECS